jgi:hypothetical protein
MGIKLLFGVGRYGKAHRSTLIFRTLVLDALLKAAARYRTARYSVLQNEDGSVLYDASLRSHKKSDSIHEHDSYHDYDSINDHASMHEYDSAGP